MQSFQTVGHGQLRQQPSKKVCYGRVGLCVFFEQFSILGRFPVSEHFAPKLTWAKRP
jgi:hypothetical protein